MNTGTADLRMGDYYGSAVNRCARVRSLGHGGQTLLSQVTADLVRDSLPDGVGLVDLGTHQLRGLSRPEKIFQLSIAALPNQFPPLLSPDGFNGASTLARLPLPPTGFIGREREVSEIAQLLLRKDVRLVTLTGAGGIGKTRLGIEVGAELAGHFPEGVFFVDLSSIEDPGLVATTIAHTIGVREGGGRPPIENLKDYLAGKEMLFVLDNFEQVIGAAGVVADLLASAPKLRILVTSRVALQLRSEHEVPVSSLTLPPEGAVQSVDRLVEADFVQLFIQQAQAVQPGFELNRKTPQQWQKFAGAWTASRWRSRSQPPGSSCFPPQEMLKKLDKSLKLLVGGPVDLPLRHRALRSAIDWSYNLLKPDEQVLFARLSVFVGGFMLESAESVCSLDDDLDVLSGVEVLLNSNLIRRVDSVTGDARFDMLHTIREYALQKLESAGELNDLRRNHAHYYTGKAEELGSQLSQPQAVSILKRIDEEHDNIRAALAWSLEPGSDPAAAARICFSIGWFWFRYGHFHEGREWSERAILANHDMPSSPLYGAALYTAGLLSMWEGDLSIAEERVAAAYRILMESGDTLMSSMARMGYGIVLINQGKHREAYSHLAASGEVFDELGDPYFKGVTLVHLANAALGMGELAQATMWLEQAWSIIREIDEPWQVAFCLNNFGEVARTAGDYVKAREYYQKTEVAFREADAAGDHARLIHTFAYLAQHEGNYEEARTLFHKSLVKFQELGNRRGIAECLAGLAGLAAEQGQVEWAVPLLSAAEALLTGRGATWWPADRVEIERALNTMQSSLAESKFEQLWQNGRSMKMEQAIRYAGQA